jgi:hypothetical protein
MRKVSKEIIMKYLILFVALFATNVFASNDILTSTSHVCVQPTITAGAYSENDAVGGQLDFENAVGYEKKSGMIQSVTIIDSADVLDRFYLNCFDQDFTEAADNAGVSYAIGDVSHNILNLSVDSADWVDLGGGQVNQVANIGKAIVLDSVTLRCQLQTTSAPTYNTDGDLTVCIDVLKDSP